MSSTQTVPWPLTEWLRYAIHWLESDQLQCELPMTKVQLFLHLRYARMNALYPHEPFSVNEATPSFFADTLGYLLNGIPENRPGTKPEDAKHDLYWRRYRDWMRSHA